MPYPLRRIVRSLMENAAPSRGAKLLRSGLTSARSASDPREVAQHLPSAHATEDGDVEHPVGRVGIGGDGEAHAVVRTVADRDGRRPGAIGVIVDRDPHRRAAHAHATPQRLTGTQPAALLGKLDRQEADGVEADAGRLEERPSVITLADDPAGVHFRCAAGADEVQRRVERGRDAEATRHVVERAHGQDAERGIGLDEARGRGGHGAVAACGLAQGMDFPASVAPFILRGVSLLGIDSVMAPRERRVTAWARLSRDLDATALDAIAREVSLEEAITAADHLMDGTVRGRIVVDVNR